MTSKVPFFSVARFVVEATSPISIAGGEDHATEDAPISRDANGLPFLPSTSISGVLRNALEEDQKKALLGFQEDQSGKRSLVEISDGLIHWSDDRPHDGMEYDSSILGDDPLLKRFVEVAPIRRDHVAISEFGIVDEVKKFDRLAVPAGARFTFELSARHGSDVGPLELFTTLIRKGLHIGAATRSGYGRLRCIRSGTETINLKNDKERFFEIGIPDLSKDTLAMSPVPATQGVSESVPLECEGPLLIGGDSENQNIDSAPYREDYVDWGEGSDKPKFVKRCVIPGSSLKGPLRHRTFFHLRNSGANDEDATAQIAELFGAPRKKDQGNPGLLRFHDICLPYQEDKTITVPHVGIDRSTAGTRNRVLFTTQMLWQPQFDLIYDRFGNGSAAAEAAFRAALNDLETGQLGIGADWGDGCGILIGTGARNAG